METNERTLDDHRLDQLRTAITVTAAAELVPSTRLGRTRARVVVAGVAAAFLALALVVGAGALGDGAVGPTPAAAVEEHGGWVTISVFEGPAPAAEVAAILTGAGIATDIVLQRPGADGPGEVDTVAALAAAETTPVATMVVSLDAAEDGDFVPMEDGDFVPIEAGDGIVREFRFRAGSDVTVQLVVEP